MTAASLDVARGHFKNQRYDLAADTALGVAAASTGVDRRAAWLLAARSFERLSMDYEALHYCELVLEEAAEDPDAITWKGWFLYQLQREDEAAQCYDRALELAPASATAHHHRGVLHRDRENHAEAIADLSAAVDDDEWGADALFLRGCSHLERGDRDGARADLEAAAAWGDMRAALTLAVELGVESADALRAQSASLARTGNSDGAVAAAERSIEAASTPEESCEGFKQLGWLQRERGEFRAALKSYRKANGVKPDDGEAAAMLGRTHYSLEQTDEAERVLVVEAKRDPANAHAHRFLGELYLSQSRNEDALAAFSRAIERDGADGHDYYRRAVAHERLENSDGERRDLLEASRLGHGPATSLRLEKYGPEAGGDFFDAAVAALQSGDHHTALEHLGEAIAAFERGVRVAGDWHDRHGAAARMNRALARIAAGDRDGALEDLQTSADKRPWDPVVWRNLARLLEELGRTEEAVAAANRSRALMGEPPLQPPIEPAG